MKDFRHEKEPFIGAEKPGLVMLMLVLAFTVGFAWGSLFSWYMSLPPS